MTTALTAAALVLLAYMSAMYLIGLLARDNSLVDIAYGPAFVVAGWSAWWAAGQPFHFRPVLLLTLITCWGLRLGLHLGYRHRGRGEDFRYRAFREAWGKTLVWRSYLQIYLLQGLVVLVILTPALLAVAAPGAGPGLLDALGTLLFSAGLFFEAVGDWQMLRFKRDPANRGRLIQSGLWRYTRHPNYFGEALLWWGVFLISLGSPLGLWGLISPLTIAFLLLKVSGIPMLEAKYANDAEFLAYKARTNAFFPWFPRVGASAPPPPQPPE